MIRYSAGLLLAGIANPASAWAAEAHDIPLLAPTTAWKVDFADDNCSIERNFGTGDNLVTLRLQRRGVNGGVDMLVMGPLVPRFAERPKLTFTFEPQGVTQSLNPYSAKVPNSDGYYMRGFGNGFVEALQWSDNQIVRMTAGGNLDIRMAWPGAKSAFEVLQQCDDDLNRERGVDMAAVRAQKSPPIPVGSPGQWLTNNDYPREVLAESGVGEVVFELVVDLKGKVSACRNLMESGWKSLDTTVCEIMKQRARFTPAIGADGQPAIGYYVNRIRFQMPG